MTGQLTFFDKVWNDHFIRSLGGGAELIQIDRLFLHELTGASTIKQLEASRRFPVQPELVFTVIDHLIDTAPGRHRRQSCASLGSELIGAAEQAAEKYGFHLFKAGDRRQGIVHVISPELGIALPGLTIVCGDSHTCTVGGVGAIGWGIGSTESEHVLVTQTLSQQRPRTMRIKFDGKLGPGVSPKDLILYLIGRIGVKAGIGYAVEFAGSAIRSLPVEGRLTLCNMAVEFSAKYGFVAPDDTTLQYLAGREFSPTGKSWDRAITYWKGLKSDDGALFDVEEVYCCDEIAPQVTWGISPQQVVSVDGRVPDPDKEPLRVASDQMAKALDYMQMTPGTLMEDVKIDVAYIGACTNARLSDLRAAAEILRHRKLAQNVKGICIPGSSQVKADAESEGLDQLFKAAGFEWHESGCGLCGHMGNDRLAGLRVISSTNRNFVGRQGVGTRTHLASPVTVAASAVTGRISDVRKLLR